MSLSCIWVNPQKKNTTIDLLAPSAWASNLLCMSLPEFMSFDKWWIPGAFSLSSDWVNLFFNESIWVKVKCRNHATLFSHSWCKSKPQQIFEQTAAFWCVLWSGVMPQLGSQPAKMMCLAQFSLHSFSICSAADGVIARLHDFHPFANIVRLQPDSTGIRKQSVIKMKNHRHASAQIWARIAVADWIGNSKAGCFNHPLGFLLNAFALLHKATVVTKFNDWICNQVAWVMHLFAINHFDSTKHHCKVKCCVQTHDPMLCFCHQKWHKAKSSQTTIDAQSKHNKLVQMAAKFCFNQAQRLA